MPHQCVRCAKVYESHSAELMKGCTCGSRVFLFLKSDLKPVEAAKDAAVEQKKYAWLEDELAFLSKDKPVSVDLDAVENLRILEQGSYEFDLPSLMKGDPLVIRSDKDIYYVKLPNPKKPPPTEA